VAAPTIVTPGHVAANSNTGNSTYTVACPTHVAGDTIYLAIGQDGGGAVLSATGFSKLYADIDIDGTATFTLFYKIAGASEPANYTVTTTVSERAVWVTFAVRGAQTTPNAQATNASGTGTTATANAITTTVVTTLDIIIISTDIISTPLGSMTSHTKLDESSLTSGATVGVYYKEIATASTDGTDAASLSATEQWVALRFALAPPAGKARPPVQRALRIWTKRR